MSREPITINEAKAHLRVDIGDDDAIIDSYIQIARANVEDRTGAILFRRNITVAVHPPAQYEKFMLPVYPVASISNAKYIDYKGVETLLGASVFSLLPATRGQTYAANTGAKIFGQTDCLFLTLDAGYLSPDDVPPALKAAVMVALAYIYEHRGDTDAALMDAKLKTFCDPHRLWKF
jgi:uncharacterized phiE125 gp8 family phage protein